MQLSFLVSRFNRKFNHEFLIRQHFFEQYFVMNNSSSTPVTSNENNDHHDIKTFVFFDMETTGLPSEEHNKTKITELSMVAVQATHIRLGVFPRVQDKLNLCFNPKKMVSFEAEKLTGKYYNFYSTFYFI